MKSRILIFLFSVLCGLNLYAYQWPIAGGFLTASFGEDHLNSFLKGVRISGHGSVVSPFLEGELIYSSSESDSLPSVLGNIRVLHHENGFRSIYGHLENTYGEPETVDLTESDQLGIVGNSGRSYEKSLLLMIYDTEMNQCVNPQMVLPPSGDMNPPIISKVFILSGNEQIELKEGVQISAGKVKILADITDYGDSSYNPIETVPYSISMFYLGNEIDLIKYDTLKEENGELILQGGRSVSFDALYYMDVFMLGEVSLKPGIAFLEITASDYYGNSSNRIFQLAIE